MGWRKTSILAGHSPAYTHCHGRQGLVYIETAFLKENLEVSAMDSSCCLHGSVKSTNVPTTAPVAHAVRISNATRDMALEHLLKYLPELWLRLPQNLRRTENCLRGGTWKQRGHFSEYGLTGWKTKPHFTLTHSHEAAAKPGDFQPQLIHMQQPIFQVVCRTPETLNAKYSDTQEAVLQLELRKPHGNRKFICANLKALIYQEHLHTHTRIQLGSCTEV